MNARQIPHILVQADEMPRVDLDVFARAADVLREARRLVVLTGAGVSTESGVPDFRSAGGIWEKFDPMDFQYDRLLDDPARFWTLRARLMAAFDIDNARPNPAHDAIARASKSEKFLGHVTQNIDGLFQMAAHDEGKLVEIHGSARTVKCLACARSFPYETARAEVERGAIPPLCDACGGVLKPGTILFGEMLPTDALAQAEEWMAHADAVLVVGSSLQVYPAAALPAVAVRRGAYLVIVNDAATPYDGEADAVLREKAGVAVPRLLRDAGLTR